MQSLKPRMDSHIDTDDGSSLPTRSRTPRPYCHTQEKSNVSSAAPQDGRPSESPRIHVDQRDRRASRDLQDITSRTPSRKSTQTSPEDSSTDFDDENPLLLTKSLPAPLSILRKGLKIPAREETQELVTPFTTPSQLNERQHSPLNGYFGILQDGPSSPRMSDEERKADHKFRRRRQAELLRRASELISFASIGLLVLYYQPGVNMVLETYNDILLNSAVIVAVCVVFYPIRLLLQPRLTDHGYELGALNIPAAFDPAPLLYPPVLPLLIASSIALVYPEAILPNIVLGLSAIPAQLVPDLGSSANLNSLHWLLTLLPFATFQSAHDSSLGRNLSLPQALQLSGTLVFLFPLHHALVIILGDLTTTSLLTSELQVLSIALINILLLSQCAQMQILATLLWVGGLGLFLFCSHVCHWNIALERIPAWRFRQRDTTSPTPAERNPLLNRDGNGDAHGVSDLRRAQNERADPPGFRPPSRKRSQSSSLQAYLNLTTAQAELRKWLYAFYTIFITLALILIPIRILIEKFALNGQEPFGWAIVYLFGDIPIIRTFVTSNNLAHWIPLGSTSPPTISGFSIPHIRITLLGPATTRLALFTYWFLAISLALLIILRLTDFAEVDTRRKVFHGLMVVMLLPTTYIDPCFLSLGLVLVLAVFLLLEIFRAAQLRPLSKPLARFLTPYVDGRDLRGPVVVSHIFLLIGCAIPLWLSLAGSPRTAGDDSWELPTRDVTMISGVVCVGMGDAAASLIGRRYGRRKWPWAGGKSLEGSLAFALAVTVGLMFGKMWLRVGGWVDSSEQAHGAMGWSIVLARSAMAAMGASFTEAVLTGANDNVVVPVVLWLLVRGLGL